MSPLATHPPSPWPSSHPLSPLHPNTVVSLPALFTFAPPAHGHTAAAEGYAHVATRICSCRSNCQGHPLQPIWRNHTHPAEPKSPITSSEKPSRASPAESPAVLLWYLGEGPKATPQPLCPYPAPPFDQVPLDLALLTGTELVPPGPSNLPEEAQPWRSRSVDGGQFVGRAASMLPFSTLDYFYLTQFSFLQMEHFYRKASDLTTQKSLQ